MKNRHLSAFILLSWAIPVFAQPAVEFIHNYNTGRHDKFYDIYALAEGGYVMCGISSEGNRGDGDLYIVKVDERGEQRWSRTYDADDNGYLYSIIETDDGDLITAGTAVDQFHALRISPDGELRWRLDFDQGECQAIIELKDGRLVLAGRNSARVPYDSRVICINGGGEVQWDRTYDQIRSSVFYGLRETEGGCVAAGHGSPEDVNRIFPWAVKVQTDNGDEIWTHHYTEGGTQMLVKGMTSAGDGGFVIIGTWLDGRLAGTLKIDGDGNEVWRRVYEDLSTYLSLQGIVRTSDMGFALTGMLLRVNDNLALHRPAIVRIASDGAERWHAFYELDAIEGYRVEWNDFNSIVVNQNDELIAAGMVATTEPDSTYDGFIMKLQPDLLGPHFIRISPEDTVLTTLLGSEIEFKAVAVSNFFRDLEYSWTLDDTGEGIQVQGDTLAVALFDSLGEHTVECRISDPDGTVSIRWHLSVDDLFIVSYSPDTLNLDIRRGTSQTFSIDSVVVAEGDSAQFQWTLTDVNTLESTNEGSESHSTVEFIHTGNFRLEGFAYCGDSRDNIIWDVTVRSVILDFWPRNLRLSVPPDSLVNFGVLRFDWESDSLCYRWDVDGDSVGSDSTVALSFAWNGQAGRSTYAVSAIMMDGAEGDTVRWEVTVREPDEVGKWTSGQVGKWGLLSVSPNPFNSTTTIRFSTGSMNRETTRLGLYSLDGKLVLELVNSQVRAGEHSYVLNGESLGAGIYLLRLKVGGVNSVSKIVLVR